MTVELKTKIKPVSVNRRYGLSKNKKKLILSNDYRSVKEGLQYDFRSQCLCGPVILNECSVEIHTPYERLDIDAIAKILLDAMNGIVYKDDRQVYRLVMERKIRDDIRIVVTEREGI
ncbi:endodeoxyribonuclease RusA (plasmid) [Leptospira interrogans serovar Linhai str. 56609]|uniref:RusA family crossover junction endodeoxyribonuclease n=1 Tax=Leptospira interrogans TaxID=173 RepID=UPI00036287E1|nr:RusA family crossover junction endodeoxyribonuclease [Leptospira interrogans]AJR16718.1 endodeoxyribonuclease RusA [Leptospira interrogans serovar Linhai str. 56609]